MWEYLSYCHAAELQIGLMREDIHFQDFSVGLKEAGSVWVKL